MAGYGVDGAQLALGELLATKYNDDFVIAPKYMGLILLFLFLSFAFVCVWVCFIVRKYSLFWIYNKLFVSYSLLIVLFYILYSVCFL